MKLKLVLLIIGITLAVLSCMQQDEKKIVKSLLIKERDDTMDTISQELVGIEFFDSIYHVTYRYVDMDQDYEVHYRLPLSNTLAKENNQDYPAFFQLLGKDQVRYKSIDYTIYKFLYDEPFGDDEETMVFFSPDFGVIVDRSLAWGNYFRLLDYGDEKSNEIIFYLGEIIISNCESFHY